MALLRRFLFRPVVGIMDRREAELRERERETLQNREAALAEARSLEAARRELEAQREVARERAEQEVEQWRGERLSEAREEIERTEARWRESLAREQADYMEELQDRVGGLVTMTLRRILPELASRTLEDQVLQNFLDRLEALDTARRTELAGALEGGSPAVVQSAAELSAEGRELVRETLTRVLGPAEGLEFEVAPALLSGVTLRIGGFTLGWNLRDLLGRLEEEFSRQLRERHEGPVEAGR